MEKSFVEDLWEKYPEQTENAIKKIGNIDEELAKRLSFKGVNENGGLEFGANYLFDYCNIRVGDFYMSGTEYIDRGSVRHTHIISTNIKWMKFMYSVYGDQYAMQYISKRNQQLDKFMADYEKKHNKETKTVLDEIGFGVNKGQTK